MSHRQEPWAADFVALKRATDRGVPPLALPDEEPERETLMMRLTRRPLLAAGILLALILVSGAAYAVVSERWKFFVDADQSEEAMDRQVKDQAREMGARAEVDVRKDDGRVKVGMTWSSLKDMIDDCHGEDGEVARHELTVTRKGNATTTALDQEKHVKLMAVLREADALSDSMADRDEAECQRRTLAFLIERCRALGIEIADAGDDPDAQIAAIERGVNAWFGPDAPFEFHDQRRAE